MALDAVFAVLLCLGMAVFIAGLLGAWSAFRDLVDYEYLVNREQWERDGRPEGGEITRRQIGFWNFSSLAASGDLFQEWGSKRPEWMVGDLTALTCLRRVRRWQRVAIAGFVVAMVAALAFSVLQS